MVPALISCLSVATKCWGKNKLKQERLSSVYSFIALPWQEKEDKKRRRKKKKKMEEEEEGICLAYILLYMHAGTQPVECHCPRLVSLPTSANLILVISL